MDVSLPAQYNPTETEGPLYAWWMKEGFFHADADTEREPYTIVIPHPTSPRSFIWATGSTTRSRTS